MIHRPTRSILKNKQSTPSEPRKEDDDELRKKVKELARIKADLDVR